ncbi:uncharacterized protein LY89DRAFT_739893 [Mollisia scopiformis]|uniref:Uncharacterized protein n=1 Tax=Mollisia scopiformis TaxID=149040 RepID=A0A194WTH1_MOLSC|nr:uncharacterized protein LY89DRAFT_739893 [Mollisia scopiformis]KUJ10912.1 hypothetical protein LY89DRAFT_739893 [Mollisia scopiformis]
MSTTFQIISEGCVYIFSRRELKFEVTIDKVQKLLRGQSKASTFNALHKGLAEKWVLRDDVVRPFGDRRQNLRFVCTLDLDRDLLMYSDESGHIQLPLDRIRKPSYDAIPRSDFVPFEISPPPQLDLAEFPPPYKKPTIPVSERRLAFSPRILSDFADQWRHILRTSYTDSTFRRLAKAVVSIAACDFQIDEVSHNNHIFFRSYYVTVLDVPSWEFYERHLFHVGGTTVVLDQDLQRALDIARDDAKQSTKGMKTGGRGDQRTYLLLSVRHMLVCHVDSAGTFSYTAATTLMDGLTPPSPAAINLLLQVFSPCRPLFRTPIHELPLEIQDRILGNVSQGPLEAARLGCVLELGSPFTWMRAVDWPRRSGPIELSVSPCHRYEISPVESKICFGDGFSGVSYR